MALTQNFDGSSKSQKTLSDILIKFQKALSNRVMNSGGLAIKAGGSALVKTVNTINCFINGTFVQKAASDMAALNGAVVATGTKQVYVFAINSSGTPTTHAGTAATTIAAIVPPTISDDLAIIGYAIVENGTGSNFTPGTTPLDTGSLTVSYVDSLSSFRPSLVTLP